eukprot:5357131-Alexandrium_andersonii.AAC.1
MAVHDMLLLGSREDRDHGSVASGIEGCDGLEDEVRGEVEWVAVRRVSARNLRPQLEPLHPGSSGSARVDGVLEA